LQPIDCQVWRDTVTARVRLCGQASEGPDKCETEWAFPVGLKSIYAVRSMAMHALLLASGIRARIDNS